MSAPFENQSTALLRYVLAPARGFFVLRNGLLSYPILITDSGRRFLKGIANSETTNFALRHHTSYEIPFGKFVYGYARARLTSAGETLFAI